MTTTSPISWTANGLNLNTYAWSVTTAGGRRYTPPTKRGEDQVIPFRSGRTYVPKTREAQLLVLQMWVLPILPDGSNGLPYEQQAHANWRTLLDALDTDEQFLITKRWYDDEGLVRAAEGYGETVGGLERESEGGYRYVFAPEILMTDPYFYGPWSTWIDSPDGLEPLGDVATSRVQLEMSAGSKVTFSDGNWMQLKAGAPKSLVDLSTGLSTSVANPAAYTNGLLMRNPWFPQYPTLKPAKPIDVTGTVRLRYRPAYR